MITALTSFALFIKRHVRQFIHVQKFNQYSLQTRVFNIENNCSKIVFFCDYHNMTPLAPHGIFQLVSVLYYINRDTGCNIHIGAKLYSLGRLKLFSSVAINFTLKSIFLCSQGHPTSRLLDEADRSLH